MSRRTYNAAELAALRTVTRHEWKGSGDPAERGPAQYAGGDWWPAHLFKVADQLERRAARYRVAAAALRREIQRTDP